MRCRSVLFCAAFAVAFSVTANAARITGRIAYSGARPTPEGYRAVEAPARGIDVEIRRAGGGELIATASTAIDGSFVFEAPAVAIGDAFEISFFARSSAVAVQDNLGKTYRWTGVAPFTVDAESFSVGVVVVREVESSGALNVASVLNAMSAYVAARSDIAPPYVTVMWRRGYVARCFTCYDPASATIYLGNRGSGERDDTDEWDDQVIAHEYAHHIQQTTSCTESPGGAWTLCEPAAETLAWAEGTANYLSVVASVVDPTIDDSGSRYVDLIGTLEAGSQAVIVIDLEQNDSCETAGPAYPSAISNLLWDLQDDRSDDPDFYSCGDAAVFSLIRAMRGSSLCDISDFYSRLCEARLSEISGYRRVFSFFGIPLAAGCPPSRRRPTVR